MPSLSLAACVVRGVSGVTEPLDASARAAHHVSSLLCANIHNVRLSHAAFSSRRPSLHDAHRSTNVAMCKRCIQGLKHACTHSGAPANALLLSDCERLFLVFCSLCPRVGADMPLLIMSRAQPLRHDSWAHRMTQLHCSNACHQKPFLHFDDTHRKLSCMYALLAMVRLAYTQPERARANLN